MSGEMPHMMGMTQQQALQMYGTPTEQDEILLDPDSAAPGSYHVALKALPKDLEDPVLVRRFFWDQKDRKRTVFLKQEGDYWFVFASRWETPGFTY